MPPALFTPTPEAAAQIRERLTCPHSSLSNIAADYHTTLDALCAWIATPEAQEPLRINESAAWFRARQCAAHRIHIAVEALLEMLAGYTYSERKIPMTASLAHVECRERQRSNARRAAHLVYRLARAFPASAPHVPPSPRSPGQGLAVARRGVEARRDGEGSSVSRVDENHNGHAPVRRVPTPLPSLEAALALGEILLSARESSAPEPVLHDPGAQPSPEPDCTALQTSDSYHVGPLATVQPIAAAPEPAQALEPDLHQLLVDIAPRPADQDHEGLAKNSVLDNPPARPRTTRQSRSEVLARRSNISDLKSMSGPGP